MNISLILETMRQMEIYADKGALVGIAELKQKLGNIDELLKQGSRQGIFSLHRHDLPSSLTEEEKQRMLNIGENYYIGVAIRRN